MKIFVFGGDGMAGHVAREYLSQEGFEIFYTTRGNLSDARGFQVDVREAARVESLLRMIKPDVVINAVGILNDAAVRRQQEAIYVNSLFPHWLADKGDELGYRLLHISTDCVFSGNTGDYKESDTADATSVYGKSKSLGEVNRTGHLTIRTSIIGPELKQGGIGLFHWFMQQHGTIHGYRQVFWNGVTTLELARFIKWSLTVPIDGLIHLASPRKISKYDLLQLCKSVFRLRDDLDIVPYDDLRSDKSLVNTRADLTYEVTEYFEMLEMLKAWMGCFPERYSWYR